MTWHIQPLLRSEETDLQRSLRPGFTSRRRFSGVAREERRHVSSHKPSRRSRKFRQKEHPRQPVTSVTI